ncbi:MAG: AMP-binding protein, partial [Candidatus Nanoarchaeia archaeon]|nr:AMP-binding protein [Candidatus Jingweiarchaeum tengchongense]
MVIEDVEALLREKRVFEPSVSFKEQANIKNEDGYKKASEDLESFWAENAEKLHWYKKWDKVLEWNLPYAKWFLNGKINACYNCVDRHIKEKGNKAAIIWEGELGETRVLTYIDLYREVNKFANVLRSIGVTRNDVVTIYMPMIPELVIAMLACARIGVPHSVVFSGFSASALQVRINDAGSKFLITVDGYYRRGNVVNAKDTVDEALKNTNVEKVIVYKRVGNQINLVENRDLWWHELMKDVPLYCEPVQSDSKGLLFIIYT